MSADNNITLVSPEGKNDLIEKDGHYEDSQGNKYPIINGIARFVAKENYAGNFGFQWNLFSKTQLDQKGAIDLSEKRLFEVTSWNKENMEQRNILEVGSGAGRFTKVILQHTKANLYSVDYSNAVEANLTNNGPHPRLHLFQADIYKLPFKAKTFDKVICLGVLQHTPDVKKSVKCLAEMVKPGGELVVDFYPIKGWYTKLHSKYLLRPFLKRLSNERLLNLVKNNIDWMLSLSDFFIKLKVDKLLNRFIPIVNVGNLPSYLNKAQRKEWAILDTFDMFSPTYDQPQKITTIKNYFEECRMKVTLADFVTYADNFQSAVVKGVKKSDNND